MNCNYGLQRLKILPLLNGLVLSGLLYSGMALGQVTAEKSALDDLIAILIENNTLVADVNQLTLDQDGRELQEAQAHLMMQKPDRFYWSITSPYEELTVTNGEKIWRYEADLEQVTIQAVDESTRNSPFALLNGNAATINAAYEISSVLLPENDRQHFVLLSKDPSSIIVKLSLNFESNKLDEMQFEDSLGQKTSLAFSNVEINISLDADVFEFVAPEGIEVIDSTGAVSVTD